MRNLWTRSSALAVTALLAGGCGGGNEPGVSAPIIAKAGTKSGDGQSGPVGQPLPSDLRVLVTRDGSPASGVTVTWATSSGGSLNPTTDETDADGVSTSTWTLGSTRGQQSATATVQGGLNSTVTFTGTATGGGTQGSTIEVISADAQGDNRFVPANLTVVAGATVTWQWVDQAAAHNVVPDDGSTPATSGSLTDGPHSYQYTFGTPGTFHYHCQAHGQSGGSGMSGTVTVVSTAPTP
jgi:plastocyanin